MLYKIILLLLTILVVFNTVSSKTINIVATEYEEEFHQQYLHYSSSKQISTPFRKLLDILSSSEVKILLDDIPSAIDTNICLKCRAASSVIVNEFKNRTNLDKLKEVLFNLCDLLTELSDTVCRGYAHIYTPCLTYIIKKRETDFWSTDEICGVMYHQYQCGAFDRGHHLNLQAGNPILKTSKVSSKSTSNKKLTFVHLTDFHYDPLYAEGSLSICTDEICCRNTSLALNLTNDHMAGKCGDYIVCDSPGYLVKNICHQVYAQHSDIDLIYFTGGFANHFQWNTSRESIKDSIKFITDVLKNTFGSITIIPVLGKHDTHPSNLFAAASLTDPTLNNKWLYSFIADQWENWLPENALTSLRENGYYTFLFRTNFRIVALNSNVCSSSNLWLLHDFDTLKEQLQWLYETLKDAEMHNEKVHIIGHIPPNSASCFKPWIQKYNSIVIRFAHIISGRFNGDSHLDEFSLFYTTESPSKCLSVAWNGGSGSSFVGLNPNYRIYYVNDENYVSDIETWIFNLTEANKTPVNSPKWYKEYSMKALYQIPDLSPDTLSEMVTNKWMKMEHLMNRFWQNKVKHSDVQLAVGCDDKCLYQTFCQIVMCP